MKKHFFCIKTELLNLKITLPMDRLDTVSSRLVSNGVIFSITFQSISS